MEKAILGKKIGMTQIFDEDGNVVPVTVVQAGPCVVLQKKTETTDGYKSVQIGFVDKPEHRVNKPLRGHFAKAGVKPKRYVTELRLNDVDGIEIGQEIKVDLFDSGEKVDVTGITKGKGFAGPIKRHGLSRGPMTHGSKYHRGVGSLGASAGISRVLPGKKMAGRMGGTSVTIQNLEVVKVDSGKDLILIKGAVPGPRGSVVRIENAIKG